MSASRTEKAVITSISSVVLSVGFIELTLQAAARHQDAILGITDTPGDPLVFHFRLAAVCLLFMSPILFSYGHFKTALVASLLPMLLFGRWIYVYHERWLVALSMDPTLGSDDGLRPNDFFGFFIRHSGDPWDVLALIAFIAFVAWQVKILWSRRGLNK